MQVWDPASSFCTDCGAALPSGGQSCTGVGRTLYQRKIHLGKRLGSRLLKTVWHAWIFWECSSLCQGPARNIQVFTSEFSQAHPLPPGLNFWDIVVECFLDFSLWACPKAMIWVETFTMPLLMKQNYSGKKSLAPSYNCLFQFMQTGFLSPVLSSSGPCWRLKLN